jgi:copper chaperone CopZ
MKCNIDFCIFERTRNYYKMKKLLIIFIGLFILSCGNQSETKENAVVDKEELQEDVAPVIANQIVKFEVEGMTCEGCENAINNSVKKLDGIENVKSSHTGKYTKVNIDTSLVTVSEIEQSIIDAGYQVLGNKVIVE